MPTSPEWTPDTPPVYDPKKTWEENAAEGPFWVRPYPARTVPDTDHWIDFLGHPVASRIGIAAGPLLNAKWIDLAGKLGFDIPTYKTIRSRAHAPHPLPNVICVDAPDTLDPDALPDSVHPAQGHLASLDKLAITNSFGNPSMDPDFLVEDIGHAKASLGPGQVLVVSCVGSEWPGTSLEDDFVATAELAKAAGAPVVEINFSCPNVSSRDGSLYLSPEAVHSVASKVVSALGSIPLIVKMGVFPRKEIHRASLVALARAGVQAVCGINTIPMRVTNADGEPTLGPSRPKCGICGNPIRQAALDWVETTAQINEEEGLGLTIIGVGGVTQAKHFQDFLDRGADFVTCATGMMWDPYLAARYHEIQKKQQEVLTCS